MNVLRPISINILLHLTGNEPAHFIKNNPEKGVNAQQLAADFTTLYDLLANYFPSYTRPKILGPDICCSLIYLNDFLTVISDNVLDAITVHQYPLEGRNLAKNISGECTILDFLSGEKLGQLIESIL